MNVNAETVYETNENEAVSVVKPQIPDSLDISEDTKLHFCSLETYYDEKGKPQERIVENFKGDVNLDGKVDLADLTLLAKYILSNEAYPLANETAYANADMNDDGVVDILDTSILIEQQLGK